MTTAGEGPLLVGVAALVATACLPLARVFLGIGFLRPVLAAAALAIGVAWGLRRVGGGPLTGLVASTVAWVLFVGPTFLGPSMVFGVLPSMQTPGALHDLWVRGIELIRLRPAPTFAEAGLLLIACTGVWAIAHTVEGLVFRLRAPVKAVLLALVLWVVPLAIAPDTGRPWVWAVPFLAAAAAVLLAFAGSDLARWGTWVDAQFADRRARPGGSLRRAGVLVSSVAILLGALFASRVPGFGQTALLQPGQLGGTTLTTNPIVNIRDGLVATDTGEVLRVRTTRPVYLRTTSLDIYSEAEEWTNGGIRGRGVDDKGAVASGAITAGIQTRVEVEVGRSIQAGSVLVPAPYRPTRVAGLDGDVFQYDPGLATLTLDRGRTLAVGDTYAVDAVIPAPSPEALDAVTSFGEVDPALTALPPNVPNEVRQLAVQIVYDAGVATPLRQVLAVQAELRSWTYSLDPTQGHSGPAMLRFINERTGYCEQFAGTMAVMLRSLGIPARVAVGFTPGRTIGDDEYSVSNANGHAWVEVLFPGAGWIQFEPTPRSDQNVLVPSVGDIAPQSMLGQQPTAGGTFDPLANDFDPRTGQDNQAAAGPTSTPGADGAAEAGGPSAARIPVLVLLVALIGMGAAAAVVRRRTTAVGDVAPARVLGAYARVVEIGRGLGLPPNPSDTEREYLARLAGHVPAAAVLAERTAQARWATAVPADAAAQADGAAKSVVNALLVPLPAWRRPVVRFRGAVATTWAAVSSGQARLSQTRLSQARLSQSWARRRLSSR